MSWRASAWPSRYETKDQEDEHSCFSDNTNADVVGDLVGVRHVYLAELPDGIDRHEHQRPRGEGRPDARREAARRRSTSRGQPTEALPAPFEELIVGDRHAPGRVALLDGDHVDRGRRASRSPRSRTSSGSRSRSRYDASSPASTATRRRGFGPRRRSLVLADRVLRRGGSRRDRRSGDRRGALGRRRPPSSTRRRTRSRIAIPSLDRRRAPRVRGRQQLLQRQLGHRAGVDRGPRRARPAVQRAVVLDVPLPRRRARSRRRTDDDPERGLLFRLSVPGTAPTAASCPIRSYGDQLQDRSILGVPPEGRGPHHLPRGAGPLRRRHAVHAARADATRSSTSRTARSPPTCWCRRASRRACSASGCSRRSPSARSSADADPDDADGDGISGRANSVWDVARQQMALGRFGWKANVPTRRAAERRRVQRRHRHHEPAVPRAAVHRGRDRVPRPRRHGGEPELDDHKLDRVTFYTRTLAVPARARRRERRGARGRGAVPRRRLLVVPPARPCTPATSRHRRARRPDDPPVHRPAAPRHGPRARRRPPRRARQRVASGAPRRCGASVCVETVNGHTRFLHDGRARNLAEAILWHGGEAQGRTASVREMRRERARGAARLPGVAVKTASARLAAALVVALASALGACGNDTDASAGRRTRSTGNLPTNVITPVYEQLDEPTAEPRARRRRAVRRRPATANVDAARERMGARVAGVEPHAAPSASGRSPTAGRSPTSRSWSTPTRSTSCSPAPSRRWLHRSPPERVGRSRCRRARAGRDRAPAVHTGPARARHVRLPRPRPRWSPPRRPTARRRGPTAPTATRPFADELATRGTAHVRRRAGGARRPRERDVDGAHRDDEGARRRRGARRPASARPSGHGGARVRDTLWSVRDAYRARAARGRASASSWRPRRPAPTSASVRASAAPRRAGRAPR